MFDIGASELLVIAIIAIIVIGPKELPLALRTAGRWIAKIRRVSSHFRTGLDAMVREAEMEEMDRKWKEQNEAIMAKYPASDSAGSDEMTEIAAPQPKQSKAEAARPENNDLATGEGKDEPPLPFDNPKKAN